MYNDDTAYIIANIVFVGLVEAPCIAMAVAAKFPWWAYVLIIIGILIMAVMYKSIAEMLFCLHSLGSIGFLIYDAFTDEINIPTAWVIVVIIVLILIEILPML